MNATNLTIRPNDLAKGNPAVKSMKDKFRLLIPNLPKNWKPRMYMALPHLDTAKGAARLTKIRQGRVAPTQEELDAINAIITQKPKSTSSRLARMGLVKGK